MIGSRTTVWSCSGGRSSSRGIDGAFAESKELVGGYAIVDLPSKDAAIEWAMRFGAS